MQTQIRQRTVFQVEDSRAFRVAHRLPVLEPRHGDVIGVGEAVQTQVFSDYILARVRLDLDCEWS